MKIVIAGGTGLIGQALTRAALLAGHQVVHVSRRPGAADSPVDTVMWDELAVNPQAAGDIDAVVNLAGETINQRWTAAAKQRILDSRIRATEAIATWVAALEQKPKVVVNGSAVGIYPASLDNRYTEYTDLPKPQDFLGDTGTKWERTAALITGTRVVLLRTGVVLANEGGAYPKMKLPYQLFAGGPIGSGQQWLSWIHIEDLVRLILFAIHTPTIEGALNGTAPHPVRNAEFGRTIGHTLRRPHWIPTPAIAFRLLFGEMATLLLDGQHVVSEKAQQAGFQYHYPKLPEALQALE